jgi:hypothetical protein
LTESAVISYLSKSCQTVKQNKNNCLELLEQTYELLNAILIIHIKATEELSPTMLHHIGKFTEYVACLVQTVAMAQYY